MTPDFHTWPTPFLGLLLLGVFSGCEILGASIIDEITLDARKDSPEWHRTGKNHYKPVILASYEDKIRIKYLSEGPNAEHENARQLMFDYCDGSYTETNRVELRGYTIIDAECTHGTESS